MSIEKFEVGKKYRFLKDGDGDKLYCSVDAKKGQEFTVLNIDCGFVTTRDVTYQGRGDPLGWAIYEERASGLTTLDDFEEVGEVVELFGDSVDTIPDEVKEAIKDTFSGDLNFEVSNLMKENSSPDLIQQMITLQQEHNLTLMFDSDEVVVHIGDNDTEYNISSQKELTTLIAASNVLKSFERK